MAQVLALREMDATHIRNDGLEVGGEQSGWQYHRASTRNQVETG
jgi:hypothetical protein